MNKPILLLLISIFICKNATGQVTQITDFVVGPAVLCKGDCGDYTAYPGVGAPTSWTYQWSNGANTSTVVICDTGTYYVTVTSIDGSILVDTFTIQSLPYIPVQILSTNSNLCPDTVSQCERACPNATITYYLSSNGTGGNPNMDSTHWTVVGSTDFSIAPDGRSITVNWGQPGNGSVTVVTSSVAGCVGEASICVNIVEEPIASFSTLPAGLPDTLEVCAGQLVVFENSSQYADIFQWFFGDDNTISNESNPEHLFSLPGVYDITLVAQSTCTCADSTSLVVRVLPTDLVDLNCIGTICPGEVVTYTAASNCPIESWSVSNGLILGGGSPGVDTITVQWSNGPTGTIEYTLQPCTGSTCPLPVLFSIPVIDDLPEISGPELVCTNERSVYRIEAFAGTDYKWSVSGGGTIVDGQGTNVITIQLGASANPNLTRWVVVEYENCYLGCGGMDSIGVRILPTFVIDGPSGLCLGENGSFVARRVPAGGNLISNWRLIDPNGAVVWTSGVPSAVVNIPFNGIPGLYRLLAEPNNPLDVCSEQARWNIQVSAPPARPTAIEGPTMICPNTVFTYQATGVTPGSRVRWTIQNGPGAPTTLVGNPINVTWGTAAPYTLSAVQLSDDELACPSDTAFLAVMEVMALPISGFNKHCTEIVGYFEVKNIPNITYNWSFTPADAGEFQGGVGSNGVRIYWQKAGPVTLSVEVCGHVSDFPLNVYGRPTPQITIPAGVCAGQTDTVKLDTAYFASLWFDDNENLLDDTSFLVVGPGSYVVFLEDVYGCPTSQEFTIEEYNLPNVNLTTSDPTGFCNNSITVTLQALTDVAASYTYEWFEDGNPLGVNAPVYATNEYSNYTVQVTDANGCTATAGPIVLYSYCSGGGPPIFSPNQGAGCPPGSVSLSKIPTGFCDSAVLQVNPGPLYVAGSANWTAAVSGGPTISSGSGDQFATSFDNAGIYMIFAEVTLTNGSTCTILDSVRVEAVAKFEAFPDCAGASTGFTNQTTVLPGISIANWNWNFGDPASGPLNTSVLQEPAHVFGVPNIPYPVSLTVTAASGCSSTFQQDVTVPGPTAAPIIGVYPRCTDLASPIPAATDLTIAEVVWDFGDPPSAPNNTAFGGLVYHRYSMPGTYTIIATATNVYGCVSSDTLDIVIGDNQLSGDITPNNPGPICQGDTLTLQAPPGAAYGWTTNEPTPSINVTQSGSYTVMVSDINGCTYVPPPVVVDVVEQPAVVVKALQVNSLGQVVGTVSSPLEVCEGEDVILRAFGQGNLNYQWSSGTGGETAIFAEIRKNQLSIGPHTFTVTVTDLSNGCSSVSAPFTVIVNPRPGDATIDASGICAGVANTLSVVTPIQPNWTVTWNTGVTGPSIVTAQPGQYFVRISNSLGCSNESNRITVFPAPSVQTLPDGCLTQCFPDTLCVPNLPNIVSWQWYFNGAILPGATNPELVPAESGFYYAELTDVRGCKASSNEVDLTVLDGFGQVSGKVWSDVNNNGVIDPADTLVSDIPVLLLQNGTSLDTTASNNIGNFVFPNVEAAAYTTGLSPALLPPGWYVVIGNDTANIVGCDAQATVAHLIVLKCPPDLGSTLNATACTGTDYDYFGTPIPAGATQIFVLQAAQGCDSTVTVQVNELPLSDTTLQVGACQGDTLIYAGVGIPAGQSQTFVFNNFLGCDSTVTVQVNELLPSDSTLQVSACVGEAYNYLGVDVPAGQSQLFVLTNAAGCDSSVTLQVTALNVSADTLNVSACEGNTYSYAGVNIPAGESMNFPFLNYLNCDSIVTVNVAALPNSSSTLQVSVCQGGAYLYNGVSVQAGTTQVFTLVNAAGCDSLVTLNVQALPPPSSNFDVVVCPGATYSYAGLELLPGETTAVTIAGANGCDSVVSVSVDTFANLVQTLNVAACSGQNYDHFGTPVPAGGSQLFQYKTAAGCDSSMTVVVAAEPTYTDTLFAAACSGEVFDYFGNPVPAGATQVFSFSTLFGCDSTVTVMVAELLPTTALLDTVICEGDTFYYQGTPILPGDSAVFSLTNAVGCDSTLTVGVSAYAPQASTLDVSVCSGDTFFYAGYALLPGSVTDLVLTGTGGCDSVVTVSVSSWPVGSFSLSAAPPCPGEADGALVVENLIGGTPPWMFALNGGPLQDSLWFGALGQGPYTVVGEDANGCRFASDTLLLSRAGLQLELQDAVLDCDSNFVTLEPILFGDTTSLAWLWSDGSQSQAIAVSSPGKVWVEASNLCETVRDEAVVRLEALDSDQSLAYLPNVFRPQDADAVNNLFRAFFPGGAGVVAFALEVYDRWGNLVFRTEDFTAGWDGRFQDSLMDPAVFVWKLEAKIEFCGRVFEIDKYGDVTIVR